MRLRIWSVIGVFFGVIALAQAEVSTVRLKDGTVLKGTRLEKEGEHWVLESPAVGKVSLREGDVQSIEYTAETPAPEAVSGVDVGRYEKKVMGDPASMAALMNLAQDPEIAEMLSDPVFRQAVQSLDVARLQQDPRFLKFMDRPDVKKISQGLSEAQ